MMQNYCFPVENPNLPRLIFRALTLFMDEMTKKLNKLRKLLQMQKNIFLSRAFFSPKP